MPPDSLPLVDLRGGKGVQVGSGVNIQFNEYRGVSLVPVSVAARNPQAVFTAAGLNRFAGRGWLTGEIDRFITANPCGYVFVEAEAGLGKTAFAARLVQQREYVSHFSRYAGGRLVRVALQNLSAQLITSFGLEELAPGGMLPEWAQDPGGFERLLGIAAARARQDSRNLVLVVDGLDEAEPSGESLPFGLPGLLPDGVFVVATYRAGRSPGRPDAPAVTIRISKDDPRNRGDISAFLAGAAAEEVLAARLADAGIVPAEFTGVLAERCDGVWVYLRYVVDEVRIGLRPPDAVADLPTGLREYYADQIRRWQRDPAWDSGLLPLAATLAVAGEPLPAATLARLAGGLDPVKVRRWCDFTFRPLLNVTQFPAAGLPLRYEVYHASFREVLKAHHGPPGPDGQPSEAAALAGELAQASLAAHDRIADTYLTRFGGFDSGLAGLAGNPGAGGADGGYPLRHLARHLQHAGRPADLHQLLAASHPASGDRHVNTWFAAHDHAGSIISYLDDLARASGDSALATAQALRNHRPAASVGMEIRYALMAASITSRTASIPASLLEQVIRAGVWAPAQGLDHARRLTDPRDRFNALVTVHPHVDADKQPGIVAEALAAATAIHEGHLRAEALGSLVPHLPAAEREAVLAQALAAATASPYDSSRAQALGSLVPHLPAAEREAVLAQALAAAAAIASTDNSSRAQVLVSLAPHLPAAEREAVLAQALAAATAIPVDHYRAQALGSLVPHLPAAEREAVLAQALATAVDTEYIRAEVLGSLAPYLPADLMPQALAAATASTDDSSRAQALGSLVPHLPAAEREAVLAQALAAATASTDNSSRAQVLVSLAPHLPAAEREAGLGQALAAATAIPYHSKRAEALSSLAPHLPADLMPQALAAATAITDDYYREQALVSLAPHLPAAEREAVLAQALAAATAITDNYSRAMLLLSLVPHLPADLMPQALAAATAITDSYYREEVLGSLASHLPAAEREAVLAQALAAATAIPYPSKRAQALSSLAPYLPADLMPQALAAATFIRDDYSRAEALGNLSPHLPAAERKAVLAQALATATAITDNYSRAQLLVSLVPHLPAAEREAVLAQALATAIAVTDNSSRAWVLGRLSPHLPAAGQEAVLAQALAAATAITDDSKRTQILGSLAPYLPANLLTHALAAVSKTWAVPLVALVERGRSVLSPDEDSEWLELLRNAVSGTDRVTCLAVIMAVAPAIADIGGSTAIVECVKAIENTHRWWP